MDDLVRAAMARWPDVPDVFGWLSLTRNGQWRLHPTGNALAPDDGDPDPEGESISNPQITSFISRNYMTDDSGRWYFQNGPQKVYVRLDAAPLILRIDNNNSSLQAHTGTVVDIVSSWWLDDEGHLYAQTNLGPGLIVGRDLPAVIDTLHTPEGQPLSDALEATTVDSIVVAPALAASQTQPASLHFCAANHIETLLGFVRRPALRYA
ncbi:hypothetical protein PuT2_01360 [Pusillimonas sp. T2]|uniref:DUF2946 family protein n=1 Tax=Pusillimonas sp. T2 TaxID=1548123 RepID=UPI000B8E56B3|nr:DUF2946 family protein [Pusillimonas sp. T2]OXR50544.1 hypothetical protein PuT2_01360 [Pusillimonas sp. T2]